MATKWKLKMYKETLQIMKYMDNNQSMRLEDVAAQFEISIRS